MTPQKNTIIYSKIFSHVYEHVWNERDKLWSYSSWGKAMAHVTKGSPSKVFNIPCIEGHLSIGVGGRGDKWALYETIHPTIWLNHNHSNLPKETPSPLYLGSRFSFWNFIKIPLVFKYHQLAKKKNLICK
jgi:hypothetical protein